jgi:hypothetical protein
LSAEPLAFPEPGPGSKSLGAPAGRMLAAMHPTGLVLPMPWQSDVLRVALEVEPDPLEPGRWRYRYRTVVVTVPRQNGKTTIARGVIAHRIAASPYAAVLGTAQDRTLAAKLWREVVGAFEGAALRKQIARVWRGFGSEEITLRNGSSYGISAPSVRAGHGLTLDLGFVDEAWAIPDDRLSQGLGPALMVRRGQLWIISTAGTHESPWLRQYVERGRAGTDPALCFVEYGAPDDADPADPATWAAANPSHGFTTDDERLAQAFRSMPLAEFERAHLNRWTTTADHALPPAWWAAAAAPGLDLEAEVGRVGLALDLAGDRSAGAISLAAPLPAGRVGLEVIDYRPGVDWLAARALDLWRRWRPAAVYIDPFGPANTVADELDRLRVPIVRANAGNITAAAAGLYDDLRDDRLRHRSAPALDLAVAGAVRRTVLDRWAFSRGKSAADISPLTSAALARYALLEGGAPPSVGIRTAADAGG